MGVMPRRGAKYKRSPPAPGEAFHSAYNQYTPSGELVLQAVCHGGGGRIPGCPETERKIRPDGVAA